VTAEPPAGRPGEPEAALDFVVGPDDTAAALGSGDVAVLATPRLLAWAEAATVALLRPLLPPGSTSVGTRVELEHLGASVVGARVRVRARLEHSDGRLRRFEVIAEDGDRVVGHGHVTRVVVDARRFSDRAGVPADR
jgi:predicted thioesterase